MFGATPLADESVAMEPAPVEGVSPKSELVKEPVASGSETVAVTVEV
jgi:hypothetical protein